MPKSPVLQIKKILIHECLNNILPKKVIKNLGKAGGIFAAGASVAVADKIAKVNGGRGVWGCRSLPGLGGFINSETRLFQRRFRPLRRPPYR